MSVVFKRKIRKWGGSLVCALPEELLSAAKLKLGDQVELSLQNGAIVAKNTTS